MGNIGTGAQPVTKTTNAILVLPKDHHIIQKKLKKNSIDMKRAAACCCPGTFTKKSYGRVQGRSSCKRNPSSESRSKTCRTGREYRKVPMERLMARLDLTRYNREAPLDESAVPVKTVRILLSQHIGAPASAIVKAGDMVTKGQMIAEPGKGLSVGIHASVNGLVTEVNEKYIVIESQEGRAGNE